MIVSWKWLQDYVPLPADPTEVVRRLMMAGLNHEETTAAGDDWAIDLEVTSNRPDCLGHLGIAREIAVLLGVPCQVPQAQPREQGPPASGLTAVQVDCPELCPQYSARVLQGVRIGPSPAWLVRRLDAVGVAAVNNVVDITNYVMLECGQPLHAFDLARLRGRKIQVRHARPNETFVAIDHRTYTLRAGTCVIADAQNPVAIAGVMGGEYSEVSPGTTELLIESAEFAPLSIRNTARYLNLHSPSSYRFERGVDPAGVDWASRRCCELVLDLAGGTLAAGAVVVGQVAAPEVVIRLRWPQIERVLGITVPAEKVRQILRALGLQERGRTDDHLELTAPTWRRDLSREIDLIEEVARVHGYEQIPEDVAVPMCPSHRRPEDRVLRRVRQVLTAHGFDEAYTASVVPAPWAAAFTPWTSAPPLISNTPMLKGADRLRVSLVPSLLEARRGNEAVANPEIELFETAHIYLPRGAQLPREQWTLAVTCSGDFAAVKGLLEALVEAVHCEDRLEVVPTALPLLHPQKSAEFRLGGKTFAYAGEVAPAGLKQFGLRGSASIAEIDLDLLAAWARLVPQARDLIAYPAITRDLNLIVAEAVRWADLEATIRQAAGPVLEEIAFREVYRDPAKDGPGHKRMLFSCNLRSPDRTLTGEEADQARDRVVAACRERHAARLLG